MTDSRPAYPVWADCPRCRRRLSVAINDGLTVARHRCICGWTGTITVVADTYPPTITFQEATDDQDRT